MAENLSEFRLFEQYDCKYIDQFLYEAFGETDEIREQKLGNFKNILNCTCEDSFRPNVDDKFLLKFLRAKKLNVDRAVELLKSYYQVRLRDPSTFRPVGKGPKDYQHLYKLKAWKVLEYRNPFDGSAVAIIRNDGFKVNSSLKWTLATTALYLMGDLLSDDVMTQIHGLSIIIDCSSFAVSDLVQLVPPSSLKDFFKVFQDTFPARLRSIHLLNQPSIYNILYYIAKPVVSSKQMNKLHLHGSNVQGLHKYFDRSILPTEYDGCGGDVATCGDYFFKELLSRHDEFVRQSKYGYTVTS